MFMPNSQMTRVKAASLVLKPIATKIIRAVPTMFCRICREEEKSEDQQNTKNQNSPPTNQTSLHVILKWIHRQQNKVPVNSSVHQNQLSDDLTTF